MAVGQPMDANRISASGMSAERLRMEVVANNIANAYSTRTPQGGPYRRQDVVFSALMDQHIGKKNPLAGVEIVGVIDDMSALPMVFNPEHPDANSDGFVLMPNVQIPIEMVNLMTATRAYEANLKVIQAFRQQADQALTILRG